MFETFDHTADVGLRIRAATREQLFEEAGRGLSSMLLDNFDELQSSVEATIEIPGDEDEYLLFDWLNELLYRFETEHVAYARFDVKFGDDGIYATLSGEMIDDTRHSLAHEVKAITYHQLMVEQVDDGWLAEVIVDI